MRYSCLLQTSLQAVYLCTYTWIVHGTLRQRHWYRMPVFDLSELGMIVRSFVGKFFFHGFIKFFVQNVKAEEKFEISDIFLWSDKIAGLAKYRNSLLLEILSNIKIFRVIHASSFIDPLMPGVQWNVIYIQVIHALTCRLVKLFVTF